MPHKTDRENRVIELTANQLDRENHVIELTAVELDTVCGGGLFDIAIDVHVNPQIAL
jgi:hypothetical protein